MPRDECLITSRLAGPCASCRRPAWPAHVRGFEVYCEACCGCGRGGAQAAGRDAAGPGHEAGPGHDALAAHRGPSENRPGIGLPAGAVAPVRGGKASDTTQGPARDPGALEALHGASCKPACPHAAHMPALPALPALPRGAARGGPRLGRLDAAQAEAWPRYRPRRPAHDAGSHSLPRRDALPAPPAMAAPPEACTRKFAPRTPRRNVSASKCSGGNFITEWRVQ